MNKKEKYDGRSRPTNQVYEKRWNEILVRKKIKNQLNLINNLKKIKKNVKKGNKHEKRRLSME